jgi:hypothetical protein
LIEEEEDEEEESSSDVVVQEHGENTDKGSTISVNESDEEDWNGFGSAPDLQPDDTVGESVKTTPPGT